MKNIIKVVLAMLLIIRYIPHIISYILHPVIREDVRFWQRCYEFECQTFLAYLYFLTYYQEFRNIVCKRVKISVIHRIFTPPLSTLYITTDRDKIGKGLFIHHGFASVISAKSIGDYCWINQQVTIGYTSKGNPTIGNNVKICAGSIVVGDITIGDNSVVGAGAIVVDDIPANSVVCSPKARVLKTR